MRIEFGNNRAVCLREEDFIEIELSGDRITYSRPNGQKVIVSLRSVWVSEPKIEVNQKPYLLGLPGNLDPQKPLHGIPSTENTATKDPSVCSEPLHPNSVRGPTEDLNSKFGQPIAESPEESLEKLKNNLEFVKIELHEELEALKIQLQDSKEVLPASISLDDLVNETKIKVSEQINCWNDNQTKEIEQLKVRLTHFEEDSLTNRERFEKHLQQFADIEFEIIKVKDEKPTRRLSDVPSINEVWDKLMKEEEEYKKKHANDFDNYYDDFREEGESNFKYQKSTSHHRSKKKNKWT